MSARVYSLLVRLYPRDFRNAWGGDVIASTHDALAAVRGRGAQAVVRVHAALVWDIVRTLPAAWRDMLQHFAREGAYARPAGVARVGGGSAAQPPEEPRPGLLPRVVDALRQDVRYALLSWRRAPGFTAFTVGTLALGMGAVVAIFSVINGVLLRPMPYADADRVAITSYHSWADRREFERASTVEAMAFWQGWRAGFREGDGVVGVRHSASVEAHFFELLGVRPALGRLFTQTDAAGNAEGSVVVSYGFWQADLGGRPDAIGSTIHVDGRTYDVIGVLPEHFIDPLGFPVNDIETSLYRVLPPPTTEDFARPTANFPIFAAAARLRVGATPESAQTEMLALVKPAYDAAEQTPDITVTNVHEAHAGEVRTTLMVLSGAVALLLLIGCVNAANLLLSRAHLRRRELTVRGALGAARTRLLAQLLTESVLIALAAGVVGIWLGFAGSRLIVRLGAESIPRASTVLLDGNVIAFSFAIALATAVLFGLAPALQWSDVSFATALRENARSMGSRTARRIRHGLVVLETALAVVLVFGAVLLGRSLYLLNSVDPGYDTTNVLSLRITMPPQRYDQPRRVLLHDELLAAIRAQPGVVDAAAITYHPLSGATAPVPVTAVATVPTRETPRIFFRSISTDYFETMGIELLLGRGILASDGAGAEPVVVLNQSAARQLFGDGNALGATAHVLGSVPARVVGIARDVHELTLADGGDPVIYMSYAQTPPNVLPSTSTFLVRARSNAHDVTPVVRAAIRGVDDTLPIAFFRTMRDMMDIDLLAPRLRALLVVCFGVLAGLLAAVGLTGVLAQTVSQTIPEIGLRMALGAGESRIAGLVIGQALKLTLAGIVIGTACALAASRAVAGFLFGVPPHDPVLLAGVAVGITVLALLAAWYPARRAARVQPIKALAS